MIAINDSPEVIKSAEEYFENSDPKLWCHSIAVFVLRKSISDICKRDLARALKTKDKRHIRHTIKTSPHKAYRRVLGLGKCNSSICNIIPTKTDVIKNIFAS